MGLPNDDEKSFIKAYRKKQPSKMQITWLLEGCITFRQLLRKCLQYNEHEVKDRQRGDMTCKILSCLLGRDQQGKNDQPGRDRHDP